MDWQQRVSGAEFAAISRSLAGRIPATPPDVQLQTLALRDAILSSRTTICHLKAMLKCLKETRPSMPTFSAMRKAELIQLLHNALMLDMVSSAPTSSATWPGPAVQRAAVHIQPIRPAVIAEFSFPGPFENRYVRKMKVPPRYHRVGELGCISCAAIPHSFSIPQKWHINTAPILSYLKKKNSIKSTNLDVSKLKLFIFIGKIGDNGNVEVVEANHFLGWGQKVGISSQFGTNLLPTEDDGYV